MFRRQFAQDGRGGDTFSDGITGAENTVQLFAFAESQAAAHVAAGLRRTCEDKVSEA
jgi:hypothetical protein